MMLHGQHGFKYICLTLSAKRQREIFKFEVLGPVSRKSRELFGPEKPVAKLQSACFEKRIF